MRNHENTLYLFYFYKMASSLVCQNVKKNVFYFLEYCNLQIRKAAILAGKLKRKCILCAGSRFNYKGAYLAVAVAMVIYIAEATI